LRFRRSVSDFAKVASSRWRGGSVIGIGVVVGALGVLGGTALAEEKRVKLSDAEYKAIREEIASILENESYDDGSYGPILVRLAWHAAGTFDAKTNTGGSNGSTMRFGPEAGHGANRGLEVARQVLEPIKKRHPNISYSDLWTLASVVAIEEMGGPQIPWRPGRVDHPDESHCPPDGRLPDAAQGHEHVRDIFYRMGFNDQEIVALVGAHALGRCHVDRSGFDGPWTRSPITFSNAYFRELKENTWTKRNWNGPVQYQDQTGDLMMLPADMALLWDPNFRKYVNLYAEDEDKFFHDFAKAYSKLLELGVPPNK